MYKELHDAAEHVLDFHKECASLAIATDNYDANCLKLARFVIEIEPPDGDGPWYTPQSVGSILEEIIRMNARDRAEILSMHLNIAFEKGRQIGRQI